MRLTGSCLKTVVRSTENGLIESVRATSDFLEAFWAEDYSSVSLPVRMIPIRESDGVFAVFGLTMRCLGIKKRFTRSLLQFWERLCDLVQYSRDVRLSYLEQFWEVLLVCKVLCGSHWSLFLVGQSRVDPFRLTIHQLGLLPSRE
ncbi:hypothetical protein Nepgr_030474 [Nepenthes gracilis]|uniref:Uncharacterized protein n=1 Tax=Nepenthes gracilis TaxID=150966 RepID=A0AAD3TG97_NEPGR|nr:hypothetical protein Nepgr_030474 [Nepenthes gracilis]